MPLGPYLAGTASMSVAWSTVDDVLDQAAQRRDHGVRYFVVVNFGPTQPGLRAGAATMAPFNKVVRGLKRL